MSDKKATLNIEGMDEAVELPIYSGTIGPDVIDVGGLTGKGMFTYDPGFVSTASCESQITYIDGGKGVLLHRGYPIDQLAEQSDYLETCYLLLYGELPDKEQKEEFVNTVHNHTMVHEQIRTFFNGFRRDAHPMAIMCGVVGALSAFYHDSVDIADERHRQIAAFRLIAKMPTLAAMSYKFSIGQPFMYPDNNLNYSEKYWPGPWTASSCYTRTTNRMLPPPPCAWRAPPAPTHSPVSLRVSPPCGAPPTVAPTRRCWRCWKRSATWSTSTIPKGKGNEAGSGRGAGGAGYRERPVAGHRQAAGGNRPA
jgi:hypothetical protein